MEGALEYLDNEGHSLAREDWRSITDKHVACCTERGLDLVMLRGRGAWATGTSPSRKRPPS